MEDAEDADAGDDALLELGLVLALSNGASCCGWMRPRRSKLENEGISLRAIWGVSARVA